MTTEGNKQFKTLLGGISIVLVGSGLVMLFRAAIPDIVRYMRIRSM